MDAERRMIYTSRELRVEDGDGGPVLTGYSAVFNSDSVPLWGFIEQIAPGAFARALREKQDVRALVDHDPARIIGRTTSGTLKLTEDSTGLLATIMPPDTQVGRDIVTSVRRGDVSGQSFAFAVRKDEWTFADDGPDRRRILDVDLYDVGPVTYPAYPATSIDARSAERAVAAHAVARRRWELDRKRRIFRLTSLSAGA